MYCSNCGEQLPVTIRVCPNCGGKSFSKNKINQSEDFTNNQFNNTVNNEPSYPNSNNIQPHTINPNQEIAPIRSASSMKYAGFWRRVLAHIIDQIFVLIPLSAIAGFCIGLIFGSTLYIETLQLLGGTVGLIIALLYYSIMNSSKRQATYGKRLMGLWVFDTNGQRLSFVHALGRIILKSIFGILFFVMLFTDRKQAVHDLIAKTVVLYSPE